MTGRRDLAVVCGVLAVAAAALWVATALVWLRVTAVVPLRGPVPVTFTGGEVRPELPGLAAVALGGVAAVLALAGWPRRVLGAGLAVAGGLAVATAALVPLGPSAFRSGAPDPGFRLPAGIPLDALRGQPVEVSAGPWLAVCAGLALALVGGWVLAREPRLPRFSARFAGSDARRRAPDRDRTWWEALDAGEDPTEASPGTRASRDDGADPRPER